MLNGAPSLLPPFPPTTIRVIENLMQQARDYDAAASECRKLAARIQDPGDGVRVYIDERHGVVRFVGPTLESGRA